MTAKVYSFHRSGTYFLCSLIKSRFYMDVNTVGALPRHLDEITGGEIVRKPGKYKPKKPLPFVGWGNEQGKTCQWKKLFGGHYCQPPRKIFHGDNKPLYIIRDGKDVMVSLWRLRNKVRRDQVSFTDWYWKFYPGHADPYVFPRRTPIAGLWWWATLSWRELGDRILCISYERLVADKEQELDKVAKYLQKKKGLGRPEEAKSVGIAPQGGKSVGRWEAHFDAEMLEHWQTCQAIAIKLVASGAMVWPST